jgi:hypothetical protein
VATTPLTGSRYPVSTDAPSIAQYFANLALDLDDNTIPRFTTTTARDTAYSSWVTLGGTMADGLKCSVNGVPYRRIGGTWRIDRQRAFYRSVSLTGGVGTIISGGSVETGVTSGASLTGGSGNSFTLYEAGTVVINAAFRAGNPGAALCSVKVNGSTIGNVAVSRADSTVGVTGAVALAAGTHSVSMRVDTSGGGVTWTDGALTLTEYTAE